VSDSLCVRVYAATISSQRNMKKLKHVGQDDNNSCPLSTAYSKYFIWKDVNFAFRSGSLLTEELLGPTTG
jgi:hypothetical protein